MDVTVRGRGVRLTDQQRARVLHMLEKLSRVDPRGGRLELEVSAERSPRLNGTKRVEATLVLPRHTIRAEAVGPDVDTALDLLVERLERQVRDYREKRKKRALPTGNRLKSPRIAPVDDARER